MISGHPYRFGTISHYKRQPLRFGENTPGKPVEMVTQHPAIGAQELQAMLAPDMHSYQYGWDLKALLQPGNFKAKLRGTT